MMHYKSHQNVAWQNRIRLANLTDSEHEKQLQEYY